MRSSTAAAVSLRAVSAALFLLIPSALCHATTLIAIWSPGEILLAADSAVIKNLGPVAVQASACKIGQQAGTSYAFSGLVEDASLGYRVDSYAQQAAVSGGDVEAQAGRFVSALRVPLAKELDALRRDDPHGYAFLTQGHPALQAIFAGVENGHPSLVVAGFGVGPEGQVGDFVRVIARGDDGRGPRIIYAGQQNQIRSYIKAHPDWYAGNRSELLRKLVQMEIDASAGEVGGPVDILAIGPQGPHWVQHKEDCR